MPKKRTREIVSRAELARRGGRTRAAVTMACRPGGALASAVVGRGVDALHPSTAEWLSTTDPAKSSTAKKGASKAAPMSKFEREVQSIALRKRRAEVEFLELRNRVQSSELIEREFVRRTVFSYLERLNLRLIRDVPLTLAAHTGERTTREERVKVIQNAMTRELTAAKNQTAAALRAQSRSAQRPPKGKHD